MSRSPMSGIYVDSFQHGTDTGYRNHACRCDLCREAGSEAARERYARNREALLASAKARQKRDRELRALLPPAENRMKPWTVYEDMAVLRKDLSIKKIASVLGRSHKAVTNRRNRLRAQGREWS